MIAEIDIPPSRAEEDIEASPPELLREPLQFIFAEHYRQRQMCHALEAMAAEPVLDLSRIARLTDFLRYDLTLHVIDEEEDLFPLLRRRCHREDEIERILGKLSADHAAEQRHSEVVLSIFTAAITEGRAPSAIPGGAETLRFFAAQERQHVALENAVVMPIARIRLQANDLTMLSKRLAARRGILLEGRLP